MLNPFRCEVTKVIISLKNLSLENRKLTIGVRAIFSPNIKEAYNLKSINKMIKQRKTTTKSNDNHNLPLNDAMCFINHHSPNISLVVSRQKKVSTLPVAYCYLGVCKNSITQTFQLEGLQEFSLQMRHRPRHHKHTNLYN